MYESVSALSFVAVRGIDPTDHGANLGAVAGLAVAILAFIGLLVFLITRWGRAGPDTRAPRAANTRPESGSGTPPASGSDSGRNPSPAGPEPALEPALEPGPDPAPTPAPVPGAAPGAGSGSERAGGTQ